jgi:hypothetical protein
VNLGTFFIFGLLMYLFTANRIIEREQLDVVWSRSEAMKRQLENPEMRDCDIPTRRDQVQLLVEQMRSIVDDL